MDRERGFALKVSSDDEAVAYLRLPSHPGTRSGAVTRSISLRDLLGKYNGPDVQLDFDAANTLIGIEIIG